MTRVIVVVLLAVMSLLINGPVTAQGLMMEQNAAMGVANTLDSTSVGPNSSVPMDRARAAAGVQPPGGAPSAPVNKPFGGASAPVGPSGPTQPGSPVPGTPAQPGKPAAPGAPAKAGIAAPAAPISYKVEIKEGENPFIPTSAAQQANKAFYAMHKKEDKAAFDLYKNAAALDEKYAPFNQIISSFAEKIKTAEDKRKVLDEIANTTIAKDPVPFKVKDYYLWSPPGQSAVPGKPGAPGPARPGGPGPARPGGPMQQRPGPPASVVR